MASLPATGPNLLRGNCMWRIYYWKQNPCQVLCHCVGQEECRSWRINEWMHSSGINENVAQTEVEFSQPLPYLRRYSLKPINKNSLKIYFLFLVYFCFIAKPKRTFKFSQLFKLSLICCSISQITHNWRWSDSNSVLFLPFIPQFFCFFLSFLKLCLCRFWFWLAWGNQPSFTTVYLKS